MTQWHINYFWDEADLFNDTRTVWHVPIREVNEELAGYAAKGAVIRNWQASKLPPGHSFKRGYRISGLSDRHDFCVRITTVEIPDSEVVIHEPMIPMLPLEDVGE